MSYVHKYKNNWARYFAVDEDGTGHEFKSSPEQRSSATELSYWDGSVSTSVAHECNRIWQNSLQQRFTDQQLELETQGWTLWNAGDDAPNVGIGTFIDMEYRTNYPARLSVATTDSFWGRTSEVMAYRLSNADGYTQGVKNINCECGKHMHMTGGNHLTNCPLNTESYIDPVKPEWKAGEPPIGEAAQIELHPSKWVKAEIIFKNNLGMVVNFPDGMIGETEKTQGYYRNTVNTNWKPIQSERDKVIAEAIESVDKILGSPSNSLVTKNTREVLETAYDLGMLSMPDKGEE